MTCFAMPRALSTTPLNWAILAGETPVVLPAAGSSLAAGLAATLAGVLAAAAARSGATGAAVATVFFAARCANTSAARRLATCRLEVTTSDLDKASRAAFYDCAGLVASADAWTEVRKFV